LYLADVLIWNRLHRHRSKMFMKAVTVVNNFFGLYVDPIAW